MKGAGPAVRRFAWLLVCTALCVLVARPVYADPAAPGGVPDPGPPPVASAPLTFGTPALGAGTTTIPRDTGPFATQLFTMRSQVELLGDRLTKLNLDVSAAQQTTSATYQQWQDDDQRARRLQQQAADVASQAYKQATGLGPLGGYAGDLHQLGHLAPGLGTDGKDSPNAETILADAAKAQQLATTDYQAYQTALATQQQLVAQQTALNTQYLQQSQALSDLTARNAAAVAAADAAQQATDSRIAGQFGAGSNTKGYTANPIALAAMRAALSKVDISWYQWGAAGPNLFDCSGLMLWSYHQAGFYGLPRVAADQYHATTRIPTSELLPGDLLFFSTTSRTDWTTISHVGMYLGDNKMVEAPTTGQKVKIATVWWSAFFGATRVVPAVPPATPVPAPPPPSPSPSHSPSPSPSSPSPSPSSPSPSSPSPSTTSRSPSPSPSHSPSPSPSPSSSRSPSASTSTSASAKSSSAPASQSSSASPAN
jgi:cell wall-associated NlpC family hydrolase